MDANKKYWRQKKRSGTFKRKVNKSFQILKSTPSKYVQNLLQSIERVYHTFSNGFCIINNADDTLSIPTGSFQNNIIQEQGGSNSAGYSDNIKECLVESSDFDGDTDNESYSASYSDNIKECLVESSDSDDDTDSIFLDDFKIWAINYNISHDALKSLSRIVNKRLPDIVPNDPRTLLKTNETKLVFFPVGTGKYWHNGLSAPLRDILENSHDVPNIVSLTFNIDGLPLFNSSRHQVWPILCHIFEKRHLPPFVIGIYEGTGKPTDIEAYLQHFVSELKDLLENNLKIKTKDGFEKICSVKIRAFICDSPARAFIKGVSNFNGKHGCLKCTVIGEYSQISHTVVFPKIDCPKRNDADFRSKKYGNHHKYDSPLLQVQSIDMIEDIPVGDSLHLIDLGITKRLLMGWRDGNFGNKNLTKLCSRDITKVSEFLISKKMPVEIHRSIRSLEVLAHWKASEFHTFLYYLSFIIVREVLCPEVYYHFLCFFCAITICSNKKHFSLIRLAEGLLKYFVTAYATIYGKEYITSNVHNLCHLIDEIKRFGTLQDFNAYPFENKLYTIKKMVRHGNKPLSQIAKRLTERTYIEVQKFNDHKTKEYPFISTKRGKNGAVSVIHFEDFILSPENHNKWFLSTSNKVVEILSINHNDGNIQIIGNSLENCTDAFEIPVKSSLLDIYMCDVNDSNKSECIYYLSDLKGKLVSVPYNERIYFMPLIHTLR